MNMRLVATATTLLCSIGSLSAQTSNESLPRPLTKINRGFTPVGVIGWDAWKLSSPKQRLAADTGKGYAPTADVIHAIYPDLDKGIGFIPTLEYRKSVDGGRSWRAASTLYQLKAQENWSAEHTHLVSEGQTVFAIFQSDAHDVSTDSEAVYVMASEDQGQNWTKPFLVSPSVTGSSPTMKRDIDSESQVALAAGICHIIFEASPVKGGGEVVHYAAVKLENGALKTVNAETRIDTANTTSNVDVDFPVIAASRGVVAIAWSDDRVKTTSTANPNYVNNHFSVVSNDGGKTFAKETKHTKIDDTNPTGWSTRSCKIAISIPNIYVFQEDSRNGTADQIYLSYSSNLGSSYQEVIASKSPTGVDLDGFWVATDGRRVVLAYRDDRNGTGNVTNNCFCVVSNTGGAGFATAKEVQVTGIDTHAIYGMEINQNVLALSLETSPGEAFWLAVSDDGGQSFEQRVGTTRTPHGDVDSPFMAMTRDNDVCAIWIHDNGQGNSKNNVYTSGMKLPYLKDLTKTNKGLELRRGRGNTGEVAFVMISSTGTNTAIRFNDTGLSVYLTPDQLWAAGAGSFAFLFVGVVDAQGVAKYPNVPNLKSLLNTDVWAAAVTIKNGSFTTGTDAIRFQ